nr:unnamed protein product [Callosobruchus chinensis]
MILGAGEAPHVSSVCCSAGSARRLVMILCYVVLLVCGVHSQKNIKTNVPVQHTKKVSTSRQGRIFFNQLFGLTNLIAGGASFFDNAVADDDDDDIFENTYKARNCTCECGVSNQENRIVGGRPTGINRYPWVARILYDGHYHCGASLLTEDFVLTAAHCVRRFFRLKKSKIRVILGDHDASTSGEVPSMMRVVSAVIRHKKFDTETYNHDIALLKLRKPVQFNKQIRPICLPSSSVELGGLNATVVGWGRLAEGGQLPSVVHEVDVPILSLSQCRAMRYRASRITQYMLCAGSGSRDSCQGDSGGPLLIHRGDKYQIVGIVSWGVGCGRPGYPGVYTRVAQVPQLAEVQLRRLVLM